MASLQAADLALSIASYSMIEIQVNQIGFNGHLGSCFLKCCAPTSLSLFGLLENQSLSIPVLYR